MSCSKVDEWIHSPDFKPGVVPAMLVEHAGTCRQCQQLLAGLELAKADFRALEPSQESIQKMRASVLGSSPWPVTEKPCTSAQEGVSQQSFSDCLVSFFRGRLGYLAAATACILLLAFMSGPARWIPLFSQRETRQGLDSAVMIRVKGGSIMGGDFKVSSAQQGRHVLQNNGWLDVSFGGRQDLWLEYSTGETIRISGTGEIKAVPAGFLVKKGLFTSEFSGILGEYRVTVPSAILGIRGTRIRFDISGASGTVIVDEGKVFLLPGAHAPAIELKPGTVLQVSGDGYRLVREVTPPISGHSPMHLSSDTDQMFSRESVPAGPALASGAKDAPVTNRDEAPLLVPTDLGSAPTTGTEAADATDSETVEEFLLDR